MDAVKHLRRISMEKHNLVNEAESPKDLLHNTWRITHIELYWNFKKIKSSLDNMVEVGR